MTAAELALAGAELGLDAIGAAPAEAYGETEQHIRERKERGLFADMGFTTRRPEVSCHPESLLPGARTVISAALCYYAPEPERKEGQGRLARYTWSDRYAELREKLEALGHRLGGSYRVLVDANDHVDREGAVRAGVAFYGKNTLAITRRHGSWVVLGTLVTDQDVGPRTRSTPVAAPARSASTPVRPARSTSRGRSIRRAASRTGRRRPRRSRSLTAPSSARSSTAATSARRCVPGTGASRSAGADLAPAEGAEPDVSLLEWLEVDGEELVARYDRLYVPRNDPRWLRRNALVAAGNVGGDAERAVVERYADDDDEVLSEHARWALARIDERSRVCT